MIGAIAGDMIGSPYERYPIKKIDFFIRVAGFTDDTVLTVAVANSILNGIDYADSIKSFAMEHYSLPVSVHGTIPFPSYPGETGSRPSKIGSNTFHEERERRFCM